MTDSRDDTLLGSRVSATDRHREAVVVPARGTEIGRFLVTAELGRGAMGSVHVAYDADLDRRVAIKVLYESLGPTPARRRELLGEAQSLARIQHPNVVAVHDVGVWQDHVYLAMEYVEGETLAAWQRARSPSLRALVEVFIAAAEGLAAAHEAGVVHRDFKPSNVLVGPNGRVVVVDFGLAIARGSDEGSAVRRSIAAPAGTPAYMSPEQYAGGALDGRSDQFSFCVALFEAVAGARPFHGDSVAALAAAITGGVPDRARVDAIPRRLRAILLRGLSPSAADRFPAMRSLVAALRGAVRPRWPGRLAVVGTAALAATLGGLAYRGPTPAGRCVPGAEAIEAVWPAHVRAAQLVVSQDAGAAWLAERNDYLRGALDRYLARWAELHDATCVPEGPSAAEPLARERASCLDNRFAAARGLIQLLARDGVEATRLDALLGTLPDLDECAGDYPGAAMRVPEDPDLAREVAELSEQIVHASMVRRMHDATGSLEEVAALRRAAYATGFAPIELRAELEYIAVLAALDRSAEAEAALDDLIARALELGEDSLAVRAINRALLVMQQRRDVGPAEVRRWNAAALGLLHRIGDPPSLLGDIHNNTCLLLTDLAQLEAALASCERAEAAYRQVEGPQVSTVAARMNRANALILLGRLEEAERVTAEASADYDAAVGRSHIDAIRAVVYRSMVASRREDRRSALQLAADALDRVRAAGLTGALAISTRLHYAAVAAALGQLGSAREVLDEARADPRAAGVAADLAIVAMQIELHAAQPLAALAIGNAALGDPATNPRWAKLQVLRGTASLMAHDAAGALAAFEAAQSRGEPDLGSIELPALATIAAIESGVAAAQLKWSTIFWAQIARHGESHASEMVRAMARGHSPESLAIVRRERDLLAAASHPGYPWVQIADGWLHREE
ncbi:MAG: protein kinase [Deltaproteobacteria bacterium]|nr:protein kinase [Deltaproteobacteria bacterium]MBP7291314.1 protein kinase [Nannocystaceae bacterium]